jgi:hypothetical protein
MVMSQIRTTLSALLLCLSVAAPAAAVEVLPMEAEPADCGAEAISAVESEADAAGDTAALIEDAELPAGLQAVGGNAAPARAPAPGGGDATTAPPAKPNSRWNAFLPGMVR